MSGEGMIPCASERLVAAANPARVAELRKLADQLYLAASGTIDPKTARLAANEIASLADALECGSAACPGDRRNDPHGGATCNGYAAVPLIDEIITGAPIGPPVPLIEYPYGARPNGSARPVEECD